MRTKIRARKKTIFSWIESKFGSLEMLAAAGGIDTADPRVRMFLKQVKTSREPVIFAIRWRTAVIEIHMEGKSSAGQITSKTVLNLDNVNLESEPLDITASDGGDE